MIGYLGLLNILSFLLYNFNSVRTQITQEDTPLFVIENVYTNKIPSKLKYKGIPLIIQEFKVKFIKKADPYSKIETFFQKIVEAKSVLESCEEEGDKLLFKTNYITGDIIKNKEEIGKIEYPRNGRKDILYSWCNGIIKYIIKSGEHSFNDTLFIIYCNNSEENFDYNIKYGDNYTDNENNMENNEFELKLRYNKTRLNNKDNDKDRIIEENKIIKLESCILYDNKDGNLIESYIDNENNIIESNTYDKNNIIESNIDNKNNTIESNIDNEDNIIESNIYDENNIIESNIDNEDNIIESNTYDKNNIIESNIDNKNNIIESNIDNEDNIIESNIDNENNIIESYIDNEDNIIESNIDNENNIIESDIDNKNNIIESNTYDEDNTIESNTYDKNNTIESNIDNENNIIESYIDNENNTIESNIDNENISDPYKNIERNITKSIKFDYSNLNEIYTDIDTNLRGFNKADNKNFNGFKTEIEDLNLKENVKYDKDINEIINFSDKDETDLNNQSSYNKYRQKLRTFPNSEKYNNTITDSDKMDESISFNEFNDTKSESQVEYIVNKDSNIQLYGNKHHLIYISIILISITFIASLYLCYRSTALS